MSATRTVSEWAGRGISFVPLRAWPGEVTEKRRPSQFSATFQRTLDLLTYELNRIKPRPVRVILEADFVPTDLRNDGYPRSGARPSFPGVVLRIERGTGEWMNLPCDTFDDWRDNLRAIALTLEKLRDIDRYGVTRRGEQYQGFLSLPARTGGDPIHSLEGAAAFVSEHSGIEAEGILVWPAVRATALKKARAKLHPDAGGEREAWDRLELAARVLELNLEGAS